jgi:hypothetical protein
MKMLLGTIVMQKISLIVILLFVCIGWLLLVPSSTEYWENVGPQWDQMLNPCNHKECNND